MPFMLAILGVTLIVTALRGTTGTLFSLVKSDFTGSGNYIWWVVSLLVIGSVGYIKRLQPVVNMFILLILVVLFIGAGKKGFFVQFIDAIKNPVANCGNSSGTTTTTEQALNAAASLPGAGAGFTLKPLAPGQSLPDPFAIGPM